MVRLDKGAVIDVTVDALAGTDVVSAIVDAVIASIDAGDLLPGDPLSDGKLAARLGISRTPVREAFQRLREIGIIEAEASRFTRIAIVSPQRTADVLVVWLALYDALIDEVIPTAPAELAEVMAEHFAIFPVAIREGDAQRIAAANVSFFDAPVQYCRNVPLHYSLKAAIQMLRLGGIRMRGPIDFAIIARAQSLLLSAVEARDTAGAHAAIALLRSLHIPGSGRAPL